LFQTCDQLQDNTEAGYSTDKDCDGLSNRSTRGADSGLTDFNGESSINRRDRVVSPPLIKLVLSPSKPRSHEQNFSGGNTVGEGKRTMEESKELLSWEEDPNVGRRKRQKSESPAPAATIATAKSDAHTATTQNEAEISAESDLWLRQLEEAAASQSEGNMEPIPDEPNPVRTPPRRQRPLSPPIAGCRPTMTSSGMSSAPSTPSPIVQQEDSPHLGAVDLTQSPSIVNDARRQGSTGDATTTEKAPRVKIMKLRRNGKLSSSPTQMPPENQNSRQAKAKGTYRRSQRLSDKMTVILKYGTDHESRKLTGSKIDAITNDSQPYRPDAPQASAPFLTPKEPPKATHPFFLSKAARKPEVTLDIASDQASSVSKDAISSNLNCSVSTRKRSTFQTGLENTKLPPPDLTTTTISLVGKSKFPTPKIPIWPPKELHHIRGNQTTIEGLLDLSSTRLLSDRMSKAKESALEISGNENILSQIAQRLLVESQISRDQVHRALRLPHRKLMTGQDLQNFFGTQLSCDLTDPPISIIDTPLQHGMGQEKMAGRKKHPALVNLYSSLETSSTAFDNGQCDIVPWTQKYAPRRAEHVLMCGPEATTLRDWISNLVVLAVDKGVSSAKSSEGKGDNFKRKRKRQRRSDDDLDGFVISSEEEDDEMTEIPGSEDELSREDDQYRKRSMIKVGDSLKVPRGSQNRSQLTNAILVSGPSGCGKTALVHAIADELGFEIFEINPGLRRSGKDIFDKVGDMTQNHLVRQHKENNNDIPNAGAAQVTDNTDRDIKLGQQGMMNSFFKAGSKTAEKRDSSKKPKKPSIEEKPNPYQNQKQSLILLEEVDILFEEDKAFWPSVLDLIRQSKRPVVMTCNDENLVPMDDLDLHAILRCNPPPHDLAVDYLLLLAANEGHILDREALSCLYRGKNSDLRASINDVDFWCQMAIGDRKGGLEWMMDRWPPGIDLDSEGRKLRVTSTNTLLAGMGWLGRDVIDGSDAAFIKHMELMSEGWDFWGIHLLDIPDIFDVHPPSGTLRASLDSLRQYERYSESLSAIDGLCVGDGSPQDPKNVSVHRSNRWEMLIDTGSTRRHSARYVS
jgi:sorting nexin-8